MGCTGSKASRVAVQIAKPDRDPEDFELDPVDMEVTKIVEFDKLFEKASESLNIIIDMNNTINDCITNIKDTLALMTGMYRVELRVGEDTDNIILDLLKTDNTRPQPEDIKELLDNEDLRMAATRLADAREELLEALEAAQQPLESERFLKLSLTTANLVAVDNNASCVDALTRFNEELEALRTSIGPNFKIAVTLKAAHAPRCKCVKLSMYKPVWMNEDDEMPNLHVVSVLDIAETPFADLLQFQLAHVHNLCDTITDELKDLGTYNLQFLKKKIKPPLPDELPTTVDKPKRMRLRNAIAAVNAELFKLHKLCFNMCGDIDVVTAVIEVVQSVKTKVSRVAEAKGLPADANFVAVHPIFEMREDASFEFDVVVETDPVLDLPAFPDSLTPAAHLCWETIMDTKDLVVELVGQFPDLKDQVEHLVEECKEFVDKAAEAASNAGLGMLEAVKAAKYTALNVKELSTSVKIFTTFIATCKRIGDELTKAVEVLMLNEQEMHGMHSDLQGIHEEQEEMLEEDAQEPPRHSYAAPPSGPQGEITAAA